MHVGWWRIWRTDVLVRAGRQGMDLGVGVVFVLKFSGISALDKALPTHEQ